jgi:polyisoprenoid-binding protein YceI
VKARFAIVLLLVFGVEPAGAEAPLWTLDAAKSRITFTAKQMAVPIPGRFERFTAAIRFDAGDLAASAAAIDIDVASVTTPNRDIETEIKRDKWFDVARFPTARFETGAFAHKGGERFEAAGRLTLRGVTQPVTLPASIRVADDPERPGMLRAEAAGEVAVRRTAFGIGQGEWRDVGVVADEVVIRVEIVARRPKAER